MIAAALAAAMISSGALAPDQSVERQLIATITAKDLDNGILSEITWDNGTLLMQGVVANPDGTLSGRYVIVPATGTTLKSLKAQSDTSVAYWDRKSNRLSPTGVGRITVNADAKMPLAGVGRLEKRLDDAVNMGGMQQRLMVRLGGLTLHEREGQEEPYDGEIWSWSPAELNRIAYVDGKGNLWVARADGSRAQKLLNGRFTLPAWSDDGKAIAVAEKKKDGRTWEVSIVLLPPNLRTPE
jgi:hypothetical protein